MRAPGGSRWADVAVVGAAVAMVTHFVHLHVVVSTRHVFEDQGVLWDVARDIRDGRLHQIDFPGQFYDSSLEAVPAAAFGAVGVTDHLAFPVGMLVLAVSAWSALAWAVGRRGHRWAAATVLLVPVALSVDLSATTLLWVTAAPRVLAVLATAAALGVRHPGHRWAAVLALGGLAVVFDTSAVLLVGPTLAWLGVEDRHRLPYPAMAIGLLVPAAAFVARALHHADHPAYDLHPPPDIGLGWKPIRWHLSNPTRALRDYGPELLPTPLLRTIAVVAVVGAVAVVVVRRGRPGPLAALGVLTAGVAFFFASNGSLRSAEFITPLPSVGRGLMALPFVLVLLWVLTLDRHSLRTTRAVFTVTALVAAGGLVHRTFTDSPGDYVDTVRATPAIDLRPVDEILDHCDSLDAALTASDTTVALSWSSTVAWSCSARIDGATILFPVYERRTWALADTWDTTQTAWVVWGHGDGGCAFAGDLPCELSAPDVVTVRTPDWTTEEAIAGLGLSLRELPDDFGT